MGDETLGRVLFMADDRDIAFHGVALDVHVDRVPRLTSRDHRTPNRASVGIGQLDSLADLHLHDRDSTAASQPRIGHDEPVFSE